MGVASQIVITFLYWIFFLWAIDLLSTNKTLFNALTLIACIVMPFGLIIWGHFTWAGITWMILLILTSKPKKSEGDEESR